MSLVAFTGGALAAQRPISTAAVKAIDRVAQAAVQQGQTAGLIVGIAKDGRTVFTKGYGKASVELDVPMTAENVVRIASVTKHFTAVAVLSLVQDGKLSLDDTVSKFIPRFPAGDTVTIRQLLSHTSGIHEFVLIPNYLGKQWRIDRTPQEMIDLIATQSTVYDFAPGTGWSYNNSGYHLLGFIIQEVTGTSLAEYYQKRLFEPIGLQQTAVDDPGDVVLGRADGYDRVSKESKELRNAAFLSMSTPGPAGFLRSTVGDLLTWSTALFAGKVIRPDLVALMSEPARLKDGRLASENIVRPPGVKLPPEHFEYGLGLEIATFEGERKIGHGGSIPGFQTRVDNFPQEALTVVVIANTQGGLRDLPQAFNRLALQYLSAPAP